MKTKEGKSMEKTAQTYAENKNQNIKDESVRRLSVMLSKNDFIAGWQAAQFKDESCDAMGHYGGEKPEGICPKCGKPWEDERQKEEEWPKDQPDIPDNKVFINGEWKSPESGEQDEELWTEVIGNVVAAESLDDNESIQEFNSRVVEILKSKFHITKK